MTCFRSPRNQGRLAALLVASSCALWSQSNAVGNLAGTVKGPGGAYLQGALIQVDTGRGVLTAKTGDKGQFLFQKLLPGAVAVKVLAKGLAGETLRATVLVNQTTSLNLNLRPVATAVVEVIAEARREAATSINTAVMGTDYDFTKLQKLPIIGDPLSAIAVMTPGTPSGGFNFNGSADSGNNFVVDGAEARSGSGGLQTVSVNRGLIEQIQILNGGVSAKYGRFMGAVVNTVTKSGTNEFQGSMTHELTSASWNALPRASDYTKSVKVPRHVLDTQSWTLLGPIIKDKLFFAVGYQASTPGGTTVVYSSLKSKLFPTYSFTRESSNSLKDIKLDWQINGEHRLSVAWNNYVSSANAGSSGAGIASYAATAGPAKNEKGYLTAGYTWLIASNLNLDAKISETTIQSGGSGTGSPGGAGITTWIDKSATGSGDLYDNGTSASPLAKERIRTMGVTLAWYPAQHALEAGFQNYLSKANATGTRSPDAGYAGTTPSGSEIWFNGFTANPASMDPQNRILAVGNDLQSRLMIFNPLSGQQDLRVTGLFVNDVWTPSAHWSYNLGARVDQYHYLASPEGSTFSFNSFTPRLGAIYDLQANGKHVFALNYSEYAGLMNTSGVANASVTGNVPVSIYKYFGSGRGADALKADGSINWSVWGKSAGLTGAANPYFASTNPLTASLYKVDPNLKAPRSREISGTYRYTDPSQSLSLTLLHKQQDRYVDDVWIGAAGTAAGQARKLITNDPGGRSKYTALEGQYRREFSPRLSTGANFTWSYVRANTFDQGGASSARNNFGGLIPDDLLAPDGLQGGQNASSSTPFITHADIAYNQALGRMGNIEVSLMGHYWSQSFQGYRSFTGSTPAEVQAQGYASSATRMFYNSPLYWPEQYRFDLHFGYEVALYKKVQLFSALDITNVFNHMMAFYINHTGTVLNDGKGKTYANYGGGLPADWLTNPNYFLTASVPTNPLASREGSVGDYSAPRKIQVKVGIRF